MIGANRAACRLPPAAASSTPEPDYLRGVIRLAEPRTSRSQSAICAAGYLGIARTA
jgi:hypothetical protein